MRTDCLSVPAGTRMAEAGGGTILNVSSTGSMYTSGATLRADGGMP